MLKQLIKYDETIPYIICTNRLYLMVISRKTTIGYLNMKSSQKTCLTNRRAIKRNGQRRKKPLYCGDKLLNVKKQQKAFMSFRKSF